MEHVQHVCLLATLALHRLPVRAVPITIFSTLLASPIARQDTMPIQQAYNVQLVYLAARHAPLELPALPATVAVFTQEIASQPVQHCNTSSRFLTHHNAVVYNAFILAIHAVMNTLALPVLKGITTMEVVSFNAQLDSSPILLMILAVLARLVSLIASLVFPQHAPNATVVIICSVEFALTVALCITIRKISNASFVQLHARLAHLVMPVALVSPHMPYQELLA